MKKTLTAIGVGAAVAAGIFIASNGPEAAQPQLYAVRLAKAGNPIGLPVGWPEGTQAVTNRTVPAGADAVETLEEIEARKTALRTEFDAFSSAYTAAAERAVRRGDKPSPLADAAEAPDKRAYVEALTPEDFATLQRELTIYQLERLR